MSRVLNLLPWLSELKKWKIVVCDLGTYVCVCVFVWLNNISFISLNFSSSSSSYTYKIQIKIHKRGKALQDFLQIFLFFNNKCMCLAINNSFLTLLKFVFLLVYVMCSIKLLLLLINNNEVETLLCKNEWNKNSGLVLKLGYMYVKNVRNRKI